MKLVLLSGGSGLRLWPLSSGSNSKQFLPVLCNDKGQIESMLQRTLRQLKGEGLLDSTYICTIKEQVSILARQVKGLCDRVIVEPEPRDTFAAMALATCTLYDRGHIGLDEVISFCPVDLYVEGAFFAALKEASAIAKDWELDLMMIGIKPLYGTSKYGYIMPQTIGSGAHDVEAFIEKPARPQAQKLIAQGALWNSGFYAFRVRFLRDYLASQSLPLTAAEFIKHYSELPKCSFDYEVSEQVKRAKVWTYDGLWNDMGSWDTLIEVVDQQLVGKGSIYDNCRNVHVINQLDIPVEVSGQSELVVVACPQGILITDKILSNGLKEHVARVVAASNRSDDLTIIADNCTRVSVENTSGLPVIVIGLTDTNIICDHSHISIRVAA